MALDKEGSLLSFTYFSSSAVVSHYNSECEADSNLVIDEMNELLRTREL
jgi:enoyl-[acyl-carrier-protein] reductase (NADH)